MELVEGSYGDQKAASSTTDTKESVLNNNNNIEISDPVSISNPLQSNHNSRYNMDSSPEEDGSSHGLVNLEHAHIDVESTTAKPSSTIAMIGFFLAGLFNNTSYVIMIAGAKQIDPSMVGVIYACNVVPSITVKLTGPYWFHLVSYRIRMIAASILMATSFILVAIGGQVGGLWLQLLGVVLGSTQSGFGEASYLALTAFFGDSRKALTYWSSGTGFAGIFGYAWVVFFTVALKASFQLTLYVALILPVLYFLNYAMIIKPPDLKREVLQEMRSHSKDSNRASFSATAGRSSFGNDKCNVVESSNTSPLTQQFLHEDKHYQNDGNADGNSEDPPSNTGNAGREVLVSVDLQSNTTGSNQSGAAVVAASPSFFGTSSWTGKSRDSNQASRNSHSSAQRASNSSTKRSSSSIGAAGEANNNDDNVDLSEAAATMSFTDRVRNTAALWPFMVPLCLVYFAEYAMQSGVWAAIGFPVSSSNARNSFYEYSNFMYQGGVLVSRSSGMLIKANMLALWVMPCIQVCLLVFFLTDAYYQFWYDWSLLIPCFGVGLLGGAVYVGGFALISDTVDPSLKEFSLSAASLADGLGIALSTVAGIFIQRALYNYHDIDDDS